MARTSPQNKKEQDKIGFFIKKLREEKGLTQKVFAKELGTSQSAVARIENGNQNLTLNELGKISKVLERKILGINESIDFRVTGGRKLKGSIVMNGSKNGAVNMICASLLNRGKTILHDIPRIEEVYRYIEFIESLGVSVRWTAQDTIEMQPPKSLDFAGLNTGAAGRTRSFTFIGALIHWAHGEKRPFRLPHSGGCKMGERTISAHRHGLEEFGVRIKTKETYYDIHATKLRPAEFVLYESSDTGAINVLLAAARIPGVSVIKFAPPNYQVQDVCFLLEKMGVQIEGIGTTTLTVHGVSEIDQTIEHYNSEDPIEAMFFIAAAAVTDSKITIKRASVNFILLELEKLRVMGLKFDMSDKYLSRNGRTELVDLTVHPSKLHAPPEKLHTQPFPGLQNDNLPFFVPIATHAVGNTLIHDWTWENRAIYFTELNRLGAKVTLLDPHRALIEGPTKLKGAQIVCPPALRPSAIILIAMLAAEGTSTLRNVYSIQRGYADLAERLNKLGAKVEVIRSM
ncbi:MAG: UDP-N-acetylglucosamine 1-carboxyvinyltransferase [Candidatus Parcubacteria bacterium]|jgi:UDP-N-acetylglucosamine 1-carboxyvinyltransferase|nr:UDP-N-acetylglucosamine 1-carboxyvinyltransferase [Candidatus Parcubacteria bacterium]